MPLTPAPGLHPIDGRDSAVLRDLLERHPVVPLLSVRGCGGVVDACLVLLLVASRVYVCFFGTC